MSFKTTGSLLVTGCLIFAFSGCQAGKLNMPKLAFWKKDEGLESKYIEPPSHQLTPSETKVAANTDDKDLPPLPPDIERTVDSFEKEVTRSYEQDAEKAARSIGCLLVSRKAGSDQLRSPLRYRATGPGT